MFRRKTPEERRKRWEGETISITVDGREISGQMMIIRGGLWPVPQRVRRWFGFKT
jgi:hypothetical protein